MSTTGAMHHGPKRRPEPSAQRTRRYHRGAPGLDGDGRSQEGVSVTRSDNRNRLCRFQRTSGLTALFEPRLGACPHRTRLGGARAQSARVASCLKPEAKREGDTSHKRTKSSLKPDDLLTWRPKMWAKNCAEACLSLAGT